MKRFVIKQLIGTHTCLKYGRTTAISTAWIIEQIKGLVEANPEVKISIIRDYLKLNHGVKVHGMKLYRAKKLALERIGGDHIGGV